MFGNQLAPLPMSARWMPFPTNESRERIEALRKNGLKVTTRSRLEAIYWSYYKEVGGGPCLILSIGQYRSLCGLVINGRLQAQHEDTRELSLAGILTRYIEENRLLRRVVEL